MLLAYSQAMRARRHKLAHCGRSRHAAKAGVDIAGSRWAWLCVAAIGACGGLADANDSPLAGNGGSGGIGKSGTGAIGTAGSGTGTIATAGTGGSHLVPIGNGGSGNGGSPPDEIGSGGCNDNCGLPTITLVVCTSETIDLGELDYGLTTDDVCKAAASHLLGIGGAGGAAGAAGAGGAGGAGDAPCPNYDGGIEYVEDESLWCPIYWSSSVLGECHIAGQCCLHVEKLGCFGG